MNVRRTNLALWSLTAVMSAGAVGAAAWGVMWGVSVDVEVVSARPAPRPATSQASPDSALPIAAFESIWALDLRRPLTESGSAPATTAQATDVTPPAAGLGGPFVLVGTIGESLAIVRGASGVVEVKGVGDVANGAKIVAIRPMQVEVDLNGQRLTIAKPREAAAEGG